MILFDLTGLDEEHPVYQGLALSNGERHYGFLQSIVSASLGIQRPFLSQTVIKAINYHAIACLHTKALQDVDAAAIDNQEFLAPLEHLVLKLLREQGAVN